MRLAPLAIVLAIVVATSTAWAQSTLTHPEVIREHTAARITCESPAQDVRFEVFELIPVTNRWGRTVEIQGAPAAYLDFSTGDVRRWAFTGPPGRYLLRIDCVDFDNRKREILTSTLTVEPEKPNPPEPVPPTPPDDIPEDQFGDLARSVAGWLSLVDPAARRQSTELGAVYLDIAERLETGKLIDFKQSNKELDRLYIEAIDDVEKWAKWKAKVADKFNDELAGGSRFDAIAAYRLVALGLGAKLIETGAIE